jgi:ligand-binding SRPBCC domain-containing protein
MSYRLTSEVILDRPLDEVFEFFADAANLEAITPPELRFRYLTPLPIEMEKGRLIEYRLSLYGVPFRWLTEIAVWDPGVCFVDQQLRGPFAKWVHTHNFEALGENRTRIYDEVEYALPLAPVGNLALPLVRAKLDRIFSYREQRVAELLAPGGRAV